MTTATITLFTTEPFVGEFGTFDLTVTDLQAEDTAISLTRIEATTGDISTATRGVALTGTNLQVGANGPTTGTITGLEFYLFDATTGSYTTLLATVSGLSIGFVEFAQALEASDNGFDDAFDAIFDRFDYVFDATAVSAGEVTFKDTGQDDTAIAGPGGSFMELDEGTDSYVAGAGFDQISFRFETGGQGAVVNLQTGAITDTYGNTETATGQFESLRGSAFDDDFLGDGARQHLRGLAGEDTLNGGGGQDYVRYDRDVREGGTLGVTVDLGTGTATDGFGDTDTLISIEDAAGTDVADALTGSAAANALFGLDGADTLNGGRGRDTLNGGADTDTASYANASGGVQVYLDLGRSSGADGKDSLTEIENVIGSAFNDRLNGDNTANVLEGGDGNDIFKGKGGDDTYLGGAGDDRMTGEDGADTMSGGADNDVLSGLSGRDSMEGGSGNDSLFGGRDSDTLRGEDGDDLIRGNRGNDDIEGGAGADKLRGGGSNDRIDGGADDDEVFGENGSDVIIGGLGRDKLWGGSGGGVLDGASDTFVFEAGHGFDQIKDWEDNRDKLDLTAYGFNDFTTEVQDLAEDRSSGLRIDFGSGDVIFIDGFAKADFDSGDVLLS